MSEQKRTIKYVNRENAGSIMQLCKPDMLTRFMHWFNDKFRSPNPWVIEVSVWITDQKPEDDLMPGTARAAPEKCPFVFHMKDVKCMNRDCVADWTEPDVEEVEICFGDATKVIVIARFVDLLKVYNRYHKIHR